MDFGVVLHPHPLRSPPLARRAEELGFTHAWFPDTPVYTADVYATMALAAKSTATIRLGTQVAVAPIRAAPVTVLSIATINKLAPGRTVLGLGSGSLSLAMMGLPPVRIAEFRRYVQTTAGLIRDGEAPYETGNLRTVVKLYSELGAFNLKDPIPLYIGASAPKAAVLAGEFGDGLITSAVTKPELIADLLRHAREGGQRAGRESGRSFFCSNETFMCVLRPGETLESERVLSIVGPYVRFWFWSWATNAIPPQEQLTPPVRRAFEAWKESVGIERCPPEKRLAALFHPGIGRYVTADVLQAVCLLGTPAELADRVRAFEAVGVTHMSVMSNVMDDVADLASKL